MGKPTFQLRKQPSGNCNPLMLFQFKGRRVYVGTGLNIPEKYWNPQTQRVRENASFPNYRQYNERLNDMAAKTVALYAEYQAKGIIPTAEEFKERLLAILFTVKQVGPELLPFIDSAIEGYKQLKTKPGSLKVYVNCRKHITAYQLAQKKPITFDRLNKAFLNDFAAYLIALGLNDNYCHKLIKTLKMFVRQALEEQGLEEVKPAIEKFLALPNPFELKETDKVYLNEAEIQQLFDMKLEERLANARDLLLVGCLTGLRYSDFSTIKPENIQRIEHGGQSVLSLIKTNQKTKQRVVLPLVHPILLAILEKNNWKAPRPISSQKLNDYLKEVCKLAGFTGKVEVNYYQGQEHKQRVFEKWELITTHTGRRSFATNAYKRGIPIKEIMQFTGHKTIASFLQYIKTTGEETAVILSEHEFFTGKSPLKLVN